MLERFNNIANASLISLVFVAMILALVIFLTDSYTPLGFAHATIYIAPLALIAASGNQKLLLGAVLLFSTLGVIGFFLSPNGIDREIAVANRLASISTMFAFLAVSNLPRRA